jgi:hypothetical protein
VILDSPAVDPAELHRRTGWEVKPQGACKGDACVPLPASPDAAGTLDAHVLSERLGMPLVHDEEFGVWALGPETGITGRALTTAVAPELTLPDLDGNPFSLSSLRGQKVVLVAWASW